MKQWHIAVIPGDGIGQEVVPAALRVLDHVGMTSSSRRTSVLMTWSG